MEGTFVPSGDQSEEPAAALPNITFFPDIDPDEFRDQLNVDTTVPNARVEAALQLSIIEVNRDLLEWRLVQEELGHTEIIETTSTEYGEGEDAVNENKRLYCFAVFHLAKARIIERMRNFDSAGSGHDRADSLEDPIGDHRREARRAVRAIMGETGTVVELI